MRNYWVGPDAIKMNRDEWKLKANGPKEFSLYYFEPQDEEEVLSRLRQDRRFVAVGTVDEVGEVESQLTCSRTFRVQLHEAIGFILPMQRFDGIFMASYPVPKAGDEVACMFSENILGRVPNPWHGREIKKLTAKNRDKMIRSLQKNWIRN